MMEDSGRQILNNWHVPSNILKWEFTTTSVVFWPQMNSQSLIMRKYRQLQIEGQFGKWLACHFPKHWGHEVTETRSCSRLESGRDLTIEPNSHPWWGALVKKNASWTVGSSWMGSQAVKLALCTTQIAFSHIQMASNSKVLKERSKFLVKFRTTKDLVLPLQVTSKHCAAQVPSDRKAGFPLSVTTAKQLGLWP